VPVINASNCGSIVAGMIELTAGSIWGKGHHEQNFTKTFNKKYTAEFQIVTDTPQRLILRSKI
jgi:hypothetical protein